MWITKLSLLQLFLHCLIYVKHYSYIANMVIIDKFPDNF